MRFEFDIAGIVHAIREDQSVREPLVRILALPSEERNDALKKLALSIGQKNGPQFLIDALMGLQKTDVAVQVLRCLEAGGEKKSGSRIQELFKRFFGTF